MGNSKFLTALKKAAEVAGDVLTTKGDILSRSSSALGRLAVSTNGKVLTCKSSETLGLSWETPAANPNTTKGDLSGFSDEIERIPIGTNFYTLQAKSSVDLGLSWLPSSTSVLTTAGDLLYASGANTLARLAKGTDNQVLKMNGSALNWETLSAGGATVTKQVVELSSAFSTSSTSFVNITGITLTIPDNTGSFFAGFNSQSENTGTGNYNVFVLKDASTQINGGAIALPNANIHSGYAMSYSGLNDGQTLLAQVKVTAGTATLNDDSVMTSRLSTLEVA